MASLEIRPWLILGSRPLCSGSFHVSGTRRLHGLPVLRHDGVGNLIAQLGHFHVFHGDARGTMTSPPDFDLSVVVGPIGVMFLGPEFIYEHGHEFPCIVKIAEEIFA